MNELQVLKDKVQELSVRVKQQELSILDDSLFAPDKAEHYQKLATQLAKSALVPKAIQNKPVDVFLVMAMAHKLKVSIEAGLQGIGVINGKPVVYGDLLLAIVKKQPDFEDIIEEPIYKGDKIFGYKCVVKRRNQTPSSAVFTLDDAKKAGLLSKPGSWQQYEARMLQLRARSFACRNAFPDALNGISSAEEMNDVIEGEYFESPISRTQKIKNDLAGEKHEKDIQSFDADVPSMQDKKTESQADSDGYDEPLAESRKGEVETTNENEEVSLINESQLKEIEDLIEEVGFGDERLEKALAYYEVNKVRELDIQKADHFMAQLQKEKNVK